MNYSKIHIWNSFFENIISGIQRFYICPNVQVDFITAESLKTNKSQQKRSHFLQYSSAQKGPLILQISTHLTLKIICSRNTAKYKQLPYGGTLFELCKKFYNLIEVFENSTISQHFNTFIYSIKTLKFSRLQG